MIVRGLQIQNEQLTAKLTKEQLLRSPTKEYMTDLLNKIVELKQTVDSLNQQVTTLN
jgi:hypothetical protein